jgi:hypothetical protein
VSKTFTFRGATRTFHNRYHFNGGTPADLTHWNTLFDAVVAAEKAVYPNTVSIVQCTGYAAGSDVPVATKAYTQAGTGSFSNFDEVPGEAAALVRYSTTARTTKNHPVYLFNWYHGIGADAFAHADNLNPANKTALETYATAWIAGFSDGTITAVRAGPNGATATSRIVSPWIKHRDFPA